MEKQMNFSFKKKKYASENEMNPKEGTSSFESSENEDFSWINANNNKLLKNFISLPLNSWKKYTFDILEDNRIIRKGFGYQDSVSKVLKNEIFKKENLLIESMKYLAVQKEDEIFKGIDNNYIPADFSVRDMNINDFKKMLEKYNYMMKMKYEIKDSVKKINIIGEIKTSKKASRKKSQQINYLYFSQKGGESTQNVIMYIIDKSFKKFYDINLPKNIPKLYCYLPKLYSEDCYLKYNDIIELLQMDEKYKIQMQKGQKKKEKINKDNFLRRMNFFLICIIILLLGIIFYLILSKNK